MSTEIKKEIALEIAHILFIDTVEYSKLSINEQSSAVDELNEVVRRSEQFQKAEAAGRLIKIPTGPHETPAQEKFELGFTHFIGTSDGSLLQKAMTEVPADFDPGGIVTQFRYEANMYLHDFAAAEKVLDRSRLTIFANGWTPPVAKAFLQGRVAAARGDLARAKFLFEAALPYAENQVKEHPETASRHAQLGIVYADLGRKEDALREGWRALDLLPESKDAYYGVDISNMFAVICARLGDGDLAMPLIERLLRTPHGMVLQDLRFNPDWDPLRKDPRFQQILESPEPKVVYN